MKKSKGSGRTITATARKVGVIIWYMLREGKEFDTALMADRKLEKKAASMSKAASLIEGALKEEEHLPAIGIEEKKGKEPIQKRKSGVETKRTGVAGKKRKKVG
jgi:hypothetical protein